MFKGELRTLLLNSGDPQSSPAHFLNSGLQGSPKFTRADRGLFPTDVIRTLEELDVGYLIPCVNAPNVADAITEFSKGERLSVSRFRITKSKNDYA